MSVVENTVGKYLSGGGSNSGSQSMANVYEDTNSFAHLAPFMPDLSSVSVPDVDFSPREKVSGLRSSGQESHSLESAFGSRNAGSGSSRSLDESLEGVWDSVRESTPSRPEMPDMDYEVKMPDVSIGSGREKDTMLREKGFWAGLSIGGGYITIDDVLAQMKEQEGMIGDLGQEANDYLWGTVYHDMTEFGEMDSLVDTAMATSDNWVHGIANYGLAKAGCYAVDGITDEHDPKKTALGGLAAVAGFTLLKEGYLQGQDMDQMLNNMDTQGDLIMNTAGGLYGIHQYEKQLAAEGETETSSRIQEAVNDTAYRIGRGYEKIMGGEGLGDALEGEPDIYGEDGGVMAD